MSKYYSYIFYADRNVRPWTILGYTLATFPKVAIYIFMHNPRTNKDLGTIARKGTLHIYQVLHEPITGVDRFNVLPIQECSSADWNAESGVNTLNMSQHCLVMIANSKQ